MAVNKNPLPDGQAGKHPKHPSRALGIGHSPKHPPIPAEALADFSHAAGFDVDAFKAVHDTPAPVSVRRNLSKIYNAPADSAPPLAGFHVPWCTHAVYLQERPAFSKDPLWHSGSYYVQEASSMFLHHVCKQLFKEKHPVIVLDACAAPGGKSTLLTDALPADSLVVSNEVIATRAGILYENITKWGRVNSIVTQTDVKNFAQLPFMFDAIVVDAPCSGSGLWRKQPDSVGEWSVEAVSTCADRQKRITADVWKALKPGGYLIYSTCSYSPIEDEQIADFIADTFNALPVSIPVNKEWGITYSESTAHHIPCYRFYPYNVTGEGFFIAVLQKPLQDIVEAPAFKQGAAFKPYTIKHPGYDFDTWYPTMRLCEVQPGRPIALPVLWEHEMYSMYKLLPVKKTGVTLGEIKGRDFIPDHAWAMSELIHPQYAPYYELDLGTALKYLRRDTLFIEDMPDGWQIVAYNNTALGWVKKSNGRINNYYPIAWRLKTA